MLTAAPLRRPPGPGLFRSAPGGEDRGVDVGEAYARYGSWIRGKVRRYLPDMWEDGVQDVLVKLQPALARLRETREEAVRALVSRTVRSVCIDELRRRARLPAADAAGGGLEELAAGAPPDAAEGDELRARVARVWGTLAARERRILMLRFRDGLSFREIAEVLDVPQGSVAGWYSRAIARLREALL